MFAPKATIYRKKTNIIAAYGVASGCGTTHFMLSLANYYRHREGLRVLYMDCAKDGDITELRGGDTVLISDIVGFRFKGVDFIPDCSIGDLYRVPQNDYDVVILEIHDINDISDRMEGYDEIYFCGSIKPWKYKRVQEFIHILISKKRHTKGKFLFLGLTGAEAKTLKDEFGIRAHKMPYIDNPFYLKRKDIESISSLTLKVG